MSDIMKGFKNAWMKGMEVIGDTASNIANNTKYKVQEMNLINRRNEILSDFGAQAYTLWQQGEQFPPVLQKQLEELNRVDGQLSDLRAERLAYVQTMEANRQERAEAEAEAAPETEEAEVLPENETVEAEEAPVAVDSAAEDIPEAEAVDAVPVLEVIEETEVEAESPAAFDDPIDALFNDAQEPVAPQPEAPSAARNSFEAKVDKALDTVQDKVSKLGKIVNRSVQNLAKVVLQSEEKKNNDTDAKG